MANIVSLGPPQMILIIIIRKRNDIENHSQNPNDNENENRYQNQIDNENHSQQVCLQESCHKLLDITLLKLCVARSMPKNT